MSTSRNSDFFISVGPSTKSIAICPTPRRSQKAGLFSASQGSRVPTSQMAIPPKYIKSRRQARRQSNGAAPLPSDVATPYHALEPRLDLREATREVILPEPEIAYAQPFYFTQCPHTSPPASRPLNVSPISVPFKQSLLLHTPEDLLSRAQDESFEIYVLDGKCGHCDLAARRQAEGLILDQYYVEVENLSTTLDALKERYLDRALIKRSPQDEKLTQEIEEGLVEVENVLNRLIRKRDRGVKRIWRGYTKRWGPGTILDSERSSQSPRRRSRPNFGANTRCSHAETNCNCCINKTRAEQGTPQENLSSVLPTRSRSYVITSSRSDTSSYPSSITCASLQSSKSSCNQPSSVSMECKGAWAPESHAAIIDTPASRFSDGRRSVLIPSPIDRVSGHGRVKVDWVRRG
ncbi:hypothetical protein PV10_09050 [Exophiala mesophila]|uniref:Uncharacterized protein n=1 Tax=Exophiala mesophila TaxID=212818 RepID=A0A0D1XIX5_EXOME|nr:uncharacterized protein PV10_09050 [Exophiala mesophila]KIV88126.1 hypothetical protein PV10_09050 [Exophiala mesophila]